MSKPAKIDDAIAAIAEVSARAYFDFAIAILRRISQDVA